MICTDVRHPPWRQWRLFAPKFCRILAVVRNPFVVNGLGLQRNVGNPFVTPILEAMLLVQRHFQAGELGQAEAICRQILQQEPLQADALHSLGLIAHHVGRHDVAIDYIQQAIAVRPLTAEFHYDLGTVYQAQGKLDLAIASYRQALQLRPDAVEARNNLGTVLAAQGKMDEAIACYERALALNPNYAEIHNNLGLALLKGGKLDEAEACWRRAVRLKPEDVEPRTNLGYALRMKGQWEEAAACFHQALQLKPDFASAGYNLGAVFAELNEWDKAIACFQKTLRLKPDFADVHDTLGSLLNEQGKVDEAVASFQQALAIRPNARLRIALATRLPIVYQSMAELESWRSRLIREVGQLQRENVVHDLTDEPALSLFYLPYQGLNDRDILRDVARLYRAPQPIAGPPAASARGPSRKIRVGFLSAYFRGHSIGHWMQGLVAHLSRDLFEVIVLSVGCHEDKTATFIKQHADRYLVVPKHLPSARQLIAKQQLDVLFYPDIGMGPVAYSLAFSRLAPVQCVTVGHPVTTGIDTIDYFISSEALETAQAEEHYTEKLVRLKNLPIYFYRPEVPSPLKEREHFGLTAQDHIYVCPQTLFKFHPEFDPLLGAILRGDPLGVLVLSQGIQSHWEKLLRQRFAATLPDVLERIRFLPFLSYPDYLNVLALADVQLDTLHFGGGSTSYDGLAVGTPIVTLPTQLLRGRITLSLYRQMQVLDCVAAGTQEYVDIAVRLGTDAAYRQAIRAKILAANAVLFENSAGIRELEQFFLRAIHEGTSP
jgi:protein O-GlcNAc transferase